MALRIRLHFFPLTLAVLPLLWSEPAPADVVTDWNLAIETCDAAHASPPFVQARRFAMAHLAMANAIQLAASKDPRAVTQQPARDLAGAVAAHDVLVALLPAERISFDALLARQRSEIPPGPHVDRAVSIGMDAAKRILTARAKDGFAQALVAVASPPEVIPARPIVHAGRSPAPVNGVDIGWRLVVPLVLKNARQFRAVAPFGPDEDDRIDVTGFTVRGITTSDTVANDPVLVARFWDESATITWNRVARMLADREGLPPEIRARLLAALNVALMDAYIAGSESRATFSTWRTAHVEILASGFDGPGGVDDAIASGSSLFAKQELSLDSMIRTETVPALLPPVPDYPPLSAVAAGAAESVLTSFLDRDAIAFVCEAPVTTPLSENSTLPSRSFRCISDATREAAIAPTFAGRHFLEGCVAGYRLGRDVGRYVAKRSANGARWP